MTKARPMGVMSRGISSGSGEKYSLFLLSLENLNLEHILTLLPAPRRKFICSKREKRRGWGGRAEREHWGRERDREK